MLREAKGLTVSLVWKPPTQSDTMATSARWVFAANPELEASKRGWSEESTPMADDSVQELALSWFICLGMVLSPGEDGPLHLAIDTFKAGGGRKL